MIEATMGSKDRKRLRNTLTFKLLTEEAPKPFQSQQPLAPRSLEQTPAVYTTLSR